MKAVLFDLDGTLIDTEQLKCSSYAQALRWLASSDLPTDSDVEFAYRKVVGLSRSEVAQYIISAFREILPQNRDAGSLLEALLEKRVSLYNTFLSDPKIMSQRIRNEVMETLKKLKQKGIKTALVTTTNKDQVYKILNTLTLFNQFDAVVTRDDVANGKPFPDLYLEAAKRLSVRGKNCIVIEDSEPGVRASLAANIFCIVVPPTDLALGQHEEIKKISRSTSEVMVLDNLAELYKAIVHCFQLFKI